MNREPSARYCSTCGRKHRVMEICPEKPGFFELLRAWARGERSAMAWLAVSGLAVIIFLNVLAIEAF